MCAMRSGGQPGCRPRDHDEAAPSGPAPEVCRHVNVLMILNQKCEGLVV